LRGFAAVTRTFRTVRGNTTMVALTLSVQILEQVRVTAAKTGESDAQATAIARSWNGLYLARRPDIYFLRRM
jgi:hypothetical protein